MRIRPKLSESFSTRWYSALISFVEEPQHPLLQGSGPLAGDDLHQRSLLLHRFVDDVAESAVDVGAAVVDVVQVQGELHPAIVPVGRGTCTCGRSNW